MSAYDDEAAALLKEMGVEFSVRYVGNGCPRFCPDQDDMTEAGKFPRKKHIHGDQHLCTLGRLGTEYRNGVLVHTNTVSFDFWNSYRDQQIANFLEREPRFGNLVRPEWRDAPWADCKKHKTSYDLQRAAMAWKIKNQFSPLPTAYSLLACLQKSDVGTFKDFCSDFGYSDDSIKALETYRAVQEEFEKVRRFFAASELGRLQDIA